MKYSGIHTVSFPLRLAVSAVPTGGGVLSREQILLAVDRVAKIDAKLAPSMPKITARPTATDRSRDLHFIDNTEKAFNFYKSVFGGEFVSLQRYKDMPQGSGDPGCEQLSEADGEKILERIFRNAHRQIRNSMDGQLPLRSANLNMEKKKCEKSSFSTWYPLTATLQAGTATSPGITSMRSSMNMP